ncbi:MAG: hypothetical protein ABIL25_06300 [candidate division WOR-3 bacterium]
MRPASLLLLFVAACLALPIAAQAANICVWNYDPLDRFFDPQVGDSIDCAYWVKQEIENLGHTAQVFNTYLPGNISGYDVVFCLMGWFRC